jgi:acetolactate synthase-1/2/3 large subunit
MYTMQSLWTMDREALDVCVVILDNGLYSILSTDHERMTGSPAGSRAASMFSLESRDGRFLDFVKIAEGHGLQAGRAESVGQFAALFERAMATKGPFLIHAVLPNAVRDIEAATPSRL